MSREFIIWLLFLSSVIIVKIAWYYIQRAHDSTKPQVPYEARVVKKRKEGDWIRSGGEIRLQFQQKPRLLYHI